MSTEYQKLEKHFNEIGRLSSIRSLLFWDSRVNLPEESIEVRAEQLSYLERLHHQYLADPELEDLLRHEFANLDPWEEANLREMRREHRRIDAVPDGLAEDVTEAASHCEATWRKAKANEDFEQVKPHLKTLVELKREVARHKAERLGVSPYQALVYDYDPGLDLELIESLFSKLKTELSPLIDEIIEAQSSPKEVTKKETYPKSQQKRLVEDVMADFGFDFSKGRLDKSEHAFSGGTTGDIRLTTNYSEEAPLQSIITAIHETGHALYAEGLPEKWQYQPVGQSRGMTAHESQSLFLEKRIAHSLPFCRYLKRKIAAYLPDTELDELSSSQLFDHLNRVERSFIRVEADEVTYPMHVIFRYELERDLIEGDLEVSELPAAWNAKMQEYLDIEPSRPSDGILQDVHWMQGAFGYFPTYTLGALMAAQLYEALDDEISNLQRLIEKGDFAPIIDWLRREIHSKGSRYSTEELCKQATGQSLSANSYLETVKRKYDIQ